MGKLKPTDWWGVGQGHTVSPWQCQKVSYLLFMVWLVAIFQLWAGIWDSSLWLIFGGCSNKQNYDGEFSSGFFLQENLFLFKILVRRAGGRRGKWRWSTLLSPGIVGTSMNCYLRIDLFRVKVTVCEEKHRGMLPRVLWYNCPWATGKLRRRGKSFKGNG